MYIFQACKNLFMYSDDMPASTAPWSPTNTPNLTSVVDDCISDQACTLASSIDGDILTPTTLRDIGPNLDSILSLSSESSSQSSFSTPTSCTGVSRLVDGVQSGIQRQDGCDFSSSSSIKLEKSDSDTDMSTSTDGLDTSKSSVTQPFSLTPISSPTESAEMERAGEVDGERGGCMNMHGFGDGAVGGVKRPFSCDLMEVGGRFGW